MVKCTLLSCILLLLFPYSVKACDGCGCPTNAGFDLSNNFGKNSIFLNYSLSRFQSNLGYEMENLDTYSTYNLGGRYYLNKRWNITTTIPLHNNLRKASNGNFGLSGIGDAKIISNYVIANEMKSSGRIVFIETGLGVKLPTGKYDSKLHLKELPENFNIGNGSFGAVLSANAVVSGYKWTYALNFVAINSFQSNSGYTFGSQVAMQIGAFRNILLSSNTTLLVGLSSMVEKGNKDINIVGYKLTETGGTGLFGNINLGIRWKETYIGATIFNPILSSYSDDAVSAKSRLNVQMNYIF